MKRMKRIFTGARFSTLHFPRSTMVKWIAVLLLSPSLLFAGEGQKIGVVTATLKKVYVIQDGKKDEILVKKTDGILFRDTYKTGEGSRLKLLFNDDSILNLGPNTEIKITENVYDPSANFRKTKIDLAKGTVRALVGKVFTGTGSKFEVHTPTAVAAARGTYFILSVTEADGEQITTVVDIEGTVVVDAHPEGDNAPEGGGVSTPSVVLTDNTYTTVTNEGAISDTVPVPDDIKQDLISITDLTDHVGEGEADALIIPTEDEAKSETEGRKEPAIPVVGTDNTVAIDDSPIQPLDQETLTGLTTDVNLIIKLDCSRHPVLCQ